MTRESAENTELLLWPAGGAATKMEIRNTYLVRKKSKLALKLAVCRRACESCGLSFFVSLALLARAGVPGAGGSSVECLEI